MSVHLKFRNWTLILLENAFRWRLKSLNFSMRELSITKRIHSNVSASLILWFRKFNFLWWNDFPLWRTSVISRHFFWDFCNMEFNSINNCFVLQKDWSFRIKRIAYNLIKFSLFLFLNKFKKPHQLKKVLKISTRN